MPLYLIIVITLSGILLLTILLYYNRFVGLRSKIREALSGIEVQMKRRLDLMPRLEAIVTDRSEELAKIQRQGRHALDLQSPAQKAGEEGAFAAKLHRVILEAHREMDDSGTEALRNLEEDLKEIEKSLHLARRYYNALVRDYNQATEKFPSALIAILLRFQKAEFFEAETPLDQNSLPD